MTSSSKKSLYEQSMSGRLKEKYPEFFSENEKWAKGFIEDIEESTRGFDQVWEQNSMVAEKEKPENRELFNKNELQQSKFKYDDFARSLRLDGYCIPEGRFGRMEFLRSVLKGEKKLFKREQYQKYEIVDDFNFPELRNIAFASMLENETFKQYNPVYAAKWPPRKQFLTHINIITRGQIAKTIKDQLLKRKYNTKNDKARVIEIQQEFQQYLMGPTSLTGIGGRAGVMLMKNYNPSQKKKRKTNPYEVDLSFINSSML